MVPARPEDLINSVITADDLRRRARGLSSTRAALALRQPNPSREHQFLELFFNGLGLLWGQLMYGMPWVLRKPYIQWVLRKMSGHPPEDNPDLPDRIHQ